MSDVFISYSRRDTGLVRRLHDSLAECGKELWVDWDGIPKGVEFLDEIYRAIEAADSFLIAISPDLAASEVCGQELEHALKHRKRLIPVVLHEVPASELPQEVSSLNWIFLGEQNSFQQAIDDIVAVMETDPEWVRTHTRLLTRAVQWKASGRERSLLLRGRHLVEVEQQLGQVTEESTPRPTTLQREYLAASRLSMSRFWRNVLISISTAFVAVLGLAVISIILKFEADDNAARAERQADRYARSTLGLQLRRVRDELNQRSYLAARDLLNDPTRCPPDLRSFVWDYYRNLCQRERRRVVEHQGAVNDLSLTADQQLMASSSDDRTIRIWSLPDLVPKAELKGHTDEIWAVEFSPINPSQIVSGSKDGRVLMWNLNQQDVPLEICNRSTDEAAVTDVCFHPEGELLAIAFQDGLLRLIDVNTGETLVENAVGFRIHDIDWSPEGMTIAAGCQDGNVRFWNDRLNDSRTFPLHEGDVRKVKFLEGPSDFATGGADGKVRIWTIPGSTAEVANPPSIRTELDTEGVVYSLSAEAGRLAWGTNTGKIVVWNRKLQSRVIELQVETNENSELIDQSVYEVCLLDNGSRLLSASHDSTIREWQVDDPDPVYQTVPPETIVATVSLTRPGTAAAVATLDGSTCWRDLKSGGPLLKLNTPEQSQDTEPFSEDDDIASVLAMMQRPKPFHLAISPDGTMVVPLYPDANAVTVHHVRDQLKTFQVSGHLSSVTSATFSEDARLLATVDSSGRLLIHTSGNGALYGTRDLKTTAYHLKFSPDAKRLFVALSDGTVEILDCDIRRLKRNGNVMPFVKNEPVDDLDTDATGLRLYLVVMGSVYQASLHQDFPVTPKLLTEADRTAIRLCCSPDGQIVATGHRDGTVQLWDAVTGDLRGVIDAYEPQNAMPGQITDLFFHPTGQELFVIDRNGVVLKYDTIHL